MVDTTAHYDEGSLLGEMTVDEGRKTTIYVDTKGNPTGGIGRNFNAIPFSADEIMLMWHNDVDRAVSSLDDNWVWWRSLAPRHQRVMINLCFNLGPVRLAGFVHFLAAMQSANWTEAVVQLKNSEWWDEVGLRGPRMARRILGMPAVTPAEESSEPVA